MRRFALLIAAIALSAGQDVLADGCMLLPRISLSYAGKAKVSSDAQKALLIWQEGNETLHLRSSYKGPATDFAWVIPVPTRPTVERSSWDLFKQAEKATRPHLTVEKTQIFGGLKFGCSAPQVKLHKETLPTGVRELQRLAIRELHIDVVQASNSGGFLRWLDKHQYAVPPEAKPIFQEYIDREFYFIVAKISKSSAWAKRKGVTETISGGLTPLAITFTAEKPFYPLAISAISSAPENELLLLCAAPQRLEPLEYGCTELGVHDVENTIAPELRKKGNVMFTTAIDFGPAIKAAQERMERPSLVVESVIAMAWKDRKRTKLARKDLLSADNSLCVSRFHAFLKPQEMRDITFCPATQQKLFESKFYIRLNSRYEQQPPASASGGIMLIALCSAIASKRKVPGKTLALILLLLALVLA
ncbi:MAG: DUF2330 domain-containing protein [Planctomycetes bacterium]|nr:DUF2330 domain-containing protein [Planctomycetota bacterium]